MLISASYYERHLVKAVADTLRERNGVAVDEKMTQAQLQSGQFLILFDGVSEVETDKQHSLREILRTSQNADFQGCRFLIATRPREKIPTGIPSLYLRPLTSDVVFATSPTLRARAWTGKPGATAATIVR